MRSVQLFLMIIVILSLHLLSKTASHTFRTAAQQSQPLYQVMLATDLMDFATVGGDPISYDNYYKWVYATWRNSPERTWWQKALFWNVGIVYDASHPPLEYAYPPRFTDLSTRQDSNGRPGGLPFFIS